jgi:hypothetical protein
MVNSAQSVMNHDRQWMVVWVCVAGKLYDSSARLGKEAASKSYPYEPSIGIGGITAYMTAHVNGQGKALSGSSDPV